MNKPKKLIEVALPLEDINREAAREKSIRHGHPSTLHLWWARRPLAACRAVIFAQMVDDPGSRPDLFSTEEEQNREREKLFKLIRDLVKWENINDEDLLEKARAEIRKYAPNGEPPPLFDPFAGGGSIPLEAQRLGLRAYAGDLNPVAVLINKALIEIPPRFAGRPPVNPEARQKGKLKVWKGAAGLAEDVRYYGKWMREEAEKRIGHLYPKYKITEELLEKRPDLRNQGLKPGDELVVIAWLWARTVTCPNPACGARMPLISSLWLSKKKGKEAWVEPIVDRSTNPPSIHFEVRTEGKPPEPPKIGRGAKFKCVACGQIAEENHIRKEFQEKRNEVQLMAVVAEGVRGRIYLPPTEDHVKIAESVNPTWKPIIEMNQDCKDLISGRGYGFKYWYELFTNRQLVALTTFSDLVAEAREKVREDAVAAGLQDDGKPLREGGRGATAYADAVATYLAFAVDRLAMTGNTLVRWNSVGEKAQHAFGRQALPMVWDFAEPNFLASATGSISAAIELEAEPLSLINSKNGRAIQLDVSNQKFSTSQYIVSTDPPYYDNIGYADLSDFFYIWLRRSLKKIYPELFGTLLTPKSHELVATPYRFGGDREKARKFFEEGLRKAFENLRRTAHKDYPVTIYYAFKQAETDGKGESVSTGWETMLASLIDAGFQITGTWPLRTEKKTRQVAMGTNALASSIVLVCRPRPEDASVTTRRDFLKELRRELPKALKKLQKGNIAPVDLAQASIGPGMAIFSRYSRVLEADGSPMTVRTALALINQALDEYLAEQEAEYDPDTRWAVAWFEQYGFSEGPYGDAETLSKAKNTSVSGLEEAGILVARAGKVRLLKRGELPEDWDPQSDRRLTVWEVTQHLIRTLKEKGEPAAAEILARVGGLSEAARELAYRLYNICERKGWAKEAQDYNALIISWPELEKQVEELKNKEPQPRKLL